MSKLVSLVKLRNVDDRLYVEYLHTAGSEDYIDYKDWPEEYRGYLEDKEYCATILGYLRNSREKIPFKGKFGIELISLEESGKAKIVGELKHSKDAMSRERITYYILPEYRGTGIADYAYKAFLEKIASRLALTEVFASVNEDNFSSVRFLLRNGFAYVGHGPDYSWGAENKRDRHFLTKSL